MIEKQLETVTKALADYVENCLSSNDHEEERKELGAAFVALTAKVLYKPKATAKDIAFTSICLVEQVGEDNTAPWSQVCIDYRDNHGYMEWRDRVGEFAYNIEVVYNSYEDLMDKLSDKHNWLNCYDFDLVPYLAGEAAERNRVCLTQAELKAIIDKLLAD